MYRELAVYNRAKHTADKAAAVTGAVNIRAVQVHANGANVDVQLCNALTDTSSDELVYSALDGDTLFFDYSMLGGVAFGTGLTVDLQGASGSVIIWTDADQATA